MKFTFVVILSICAAGGLKSLARNDGREEMQSNIDNWITEAAGNWPTGGANVYNNFIMGLFGE